MKPSPKPYDIVKRAADIMVSGVALVVLSPVLAATAVLVLVDLGRPVLFAQMRPGRGGRLFKMYKFRTMRPGDAGVAADALVDTDSERLSSLGRSLRSWSLDELPELYNVLIGDMSLVGPRPLLPEYLDRYNAHQARRHEVRPGVTGLAQVSGRNATSWEERFDLDVYYVDHRSARLDLRILWQTVATVLRREGVSAQGHATMAPFDPQGPDDDHSGETP